MKSISFLIFLISMPVSAGTIVFKNMYVSHSFIMGEGPTGADAARDAFSAMPDGYKADRANGQYIECTKSLLQEDVTCDSSIRENRYRIVQPIIEANSP